MLSRGMMQLRSAARAASGLVPVAWAAAQRLSATSMLGSNPMHLQSVKAQARPAAVAVSTVGWQQSASVYLPPGPGPELYLRQYKKHGLQELLAQLGLPTEGTARVLAERLHAHVAKHIADDLRRQFKITEQRRGGSMTPAHLGQQLWQLVTWTDPLLGGMLTDVGAEKPEQLRTVKAAAEPLWQQLVEAPSSGELSLQKGLKQTLQLILGADNPHGFSFLDTSVTPLRGLKNRPGYVMVTGPSADPTCVISAGELAVSSPAAAFGQLALLFELLGALPWWRTMWVGFVLEENKVYAFSWNKLGPYAEMGEWAGTGPHALTGPDARGIDILASLAWAPPELAESPSAQDGAFTWPAEAAAGLNAGLHPGG